VRKPAGQDTIIEAIIWSWMMTTGTAWLSQDVIQRLVNIQWKRRHSTI